MLYDTLNNSSCYGQDFKPAGAISNREHFTIRGIS